MQTAIRPAAVAGLFYPRDQGALADLISRLLADAHPPVSHQAPKALIVPHAGLVYSGPVAATAYALLRARPHLGRVVLVGPSHRVPFNGLVASGAEVWRTPLGDMPVDVRGLAAVPGLQSSPRAHAPEHSLEVQLPFLQTVLPHVQILPILVGFAEAHEVSRVLEKLDSGDETLFLISSDLSHYLTYEAAQTLDQQTAGQILALKPDDLTPEQACGCTGVSGLLQTARRRNLRPALLDLRNSGDTAGDKSRVVGYGAFAFYEGKHAD